MIIGIHLIINLIIMEIFKFYIHNHRLQSLSFEALHLFYLIALTMITTMES